MSYSPLIVNAVNEMLKRDEDGKDYMRNSKRAINSI